MTAVASFAVLLLSVVLDQPAPAYMSVISDSVVNCASVSTVSFSRTGDDYGDTVGRAYRFVQCCCIRFVENLSSGLNAILYPAS